MKRVLCSLFVLTILLYIIPIQSGAAEKPVILYYEDGSYITAEVFIGRTRASGSVSGSKTYTYYAGDGNTQWKATLSGSFTYSGSSAVCTSSSVDVTIYDSSWYTISKSSSKSGHSASGFVTMGEKLGGLTVTRVPVSMSISCDKDGNLG